MFCPNCGTQNSETASTCTKCGFNLKGAAAPKFKGTMLMNQSPGAPAPAPQAPMAPGMPPVAPMNQGLAGTVVGVAPAGLGASPGAPPAPPPPTAGGYGAPPAQPGYGAPPAQPGYGAPPAQPGYGAPPGGPGGYSPPGAPQGGVNPLGGTMAIDQMPNFGAPGAPPAGPPPGAPGGYGAPPPAAPPPGFPPPQGAPPGGGFGAPAQDPYGAPPGGQPGGFGGPQPGYGAPPGGQPGGFGGPQPGYGAPPGGQPGGFGGPQPGYGAPPGGQPAQDFAAAGAAFGAAANNAFGAMTAPAPAAGSKPTVRNPVMTLVIAWGILVGINIVGGILVGVLAALISPALASLSSLFSLVAFLGFGFYLKSLLLELQAFTGDQNFKWWFILVPLLNIYFMWIKVPEQVTNAKNKAGIAQSKPTKGIVLYVFLFPWALANDLNDIAQG